MLHFLSNHIEELHVINYTGKKKIANTRVGTEFIKQDQKRKLTTRAQVTLIMTKREQKA